MSTEKSAAQTLAEQVGGEYAVERAQTIIDLLGKLHLDHASALAAGDAGAARRDVDLASDLVSEATLPVLRAAAILASAPPILRPVPVVYGPQDVQAIVSADEVMGLAGVFAAAAVGSYKGTITDQQVDEAERRLREAVERLATAAFASEVGRSLA